MTSGSCDNFQFSRWIATVVHAGTQAIRAEQAAGSGYGAADGAGRRSSYNIGHVRILVDTVQLYPQVRAGRDGL